MMVEIKRLLVVALTALACVSMWGCGDKVSFEWGKYRSDESVAGFINDCKTSSGKTYHDRGYTPKQGDIIFFDWDGGGADHIGIVQKVENGNILTIEGNSSDAVNERTYGVNSSNVYGFCSWY